MNARIRITGQANGNFKIFRKLNQYKSKKEAHQDIILDYANRTIAREDLTNAFNQLCSQEPELKNKVGGIFKANDILYYDASKAVIEYKS